MNSKNKNIKSTFFAAVGGLFLCVTLSPANAAVIYTDRADVEASSSNLTNIDFESYSGAGTHVGDFTNSGISFDAKATYGNDGYLFSYGPSSGYNIGSGNWMLGGFSVPSSYRRFMDISVPADYDLFGLDVGTYGNNGFVSVIAATSLGMFEQIVATPYGTSSFVGFSLAVGETLSYLRVENVASATGGVGHDNFIFDNFTFGNKSATVPEPAPFILLALGLLALSFSRRQLK